MDNDSIRRSILTDVDEVVARLACVLTIASSPSLQSEIRRFVGAPPDVAFAAQLPASKSWILVENLSRAALVHQPPLDVPNIDLDVPFSVGGPLREALEKATEETEGFQRAYGLLTPVFDVTAPRSRAQMVDLMAWTPTFGPLAMRIATRGVMLVDALRRDMLAGLDAPTPQADLRVREYVGLLRTIADLQLLAADAGARPWLEGMAKSFQWRQWTPSWSLVRERLVEFTPAAAWSVQALGPGVVESYLDALVRADQLMLIFDALFGLVALALSAPAEVPAIVSAIKNRRAFIQTPAASERDFVTWLVTAASTVIAAPNLTKRQLADAAGFRGPMQPDRLLSHVLVNFREYDAVDPLAGQSTPLAFALLPVILAGERGDAYPEPAMADRSTEQMRQALRRAWAAASRPPRAVVH